MKFHYWKHLIIILLIALLAWSLQFFILFLAIDPLTLARSHNRSLLEYLTEAKKQIDKGALISSATLPKWVEETRNHIAAAIVVANDQAIALNEVAKDKSGPNLGTLNTFLASIIAILGTFSTIILSWRKDMRETRQELEKYKSKTPSIVMP
jgi:hypothetical protein